MRSKIPPVAVAVLTALASVAAVRLIYTRNDDINILRLSPPSPRPRDNCPRRSVDLSATYGRVNGTIFNKKTRVVFSKPHEFFSDAGVGSFANLRFDDQHHLPTDLRLVNGRRLTREEIAFIEDGR